MSMFIEWDNEWWDLPPLDEEPPRRTFREQVGWALHNLIAHPLSELLYWLFGETAANWIHDITIPDHEPGFGRG